MPGTYYIRETRTLEGYELYNKLIKIELELNEKTTVNVINSEEEPEITINNIETEISVEQSKSEVEIQESSNKIEIQESDDKIEMKNEENKVVVKLPKTGM